MSGRLRALPPALALLAAVAVVSLAARLAFLADPCAAPCRTAADRVLVFDEVYYVNAARAIAGVAIPPDQPPGSHYVGTPRGEDPNAEHPQLAKLVIAGAIRLFGDGPFAWRIGSVLAGTLALLGMFALARAAGAGPYPALVAAALMASDNLLIVHGRIATLDIYAVAAMVWAGALYLRRRPVAAGLVLALGAAAKEVALYALVALVLVEAARWWRARGVGPTATLRAAAGRLAACMLACAGGFLALLAVMDRIAPPYDGTAGVRIGGGPLGHIGHILSFAARQSSPHGPTGIASAPWGWLVDVKPIVYLNVNPAQPAPGLEHVHPAVHFLGMMSPPMMLLALPALALAAWSWLAPGRRRLRGTPPDDGDWALGESEAVAPAWVLGTLGPFWVLSLAWHRTSYLYYMTIVMPGVYLALAALVTRLRRRRVVLGGWALLIILAAVLMYPLTPLP